MNKEQVIRELIQYIILEEEKFKNDALLENTEKQQVKKTVVDKILKKLDESTSEL